MLEGASQRIPVPQKGEPAVPSPKINSSLHSLMTHTALSTAQCELVRRQVAEAFPEFVSFGAFDQWHLALLRFATQLPLVYTRSETIAAQLRYLNMHAADTLYAMEQHSGPLTHALLSLLRPGASWSHADPPSIDKPEHIAEFDSVWHPEYQRYCEHVLNHLIRVPLAILGKQCNRDYLSVVPLRSRVELLVNNGLGEFTAGYDRIVRNSIAHGSIRYSISGIDYSDGPDEHSLAAFEFSELFDKLVDTCHSSAVALILFLAANRAAVEKLGPSRLPLALRFMLLDAQASRPTMQLEYVAESSHGGQLNLIARINSRSRWVQLFEALRLCVAAHDSGMIDFERYFVSFDCGRPTPASVIIDGARLRRAIQAEEPLESCAGDLVQTALLWYDAPPWEMKRYSLSGSLRVHMQLTARQTTERLRARGVNTVRSEYAILDVRNASSSSLRRVEAYLVLNNPSETATDHLNQVVRDAVGRLKKRWVRRSNLNGSTGVPRWPDVVRVRLLAKRRRLSSVKASGWSERDLLLVAEWIRPGCGAQPFYTRQCDENLHGIRVRFRPNRGNAGARASRKT